MCLGFQEEHDPIEEAVDKAIDAGKLIIAAASNNGGLSGRARPARHEGVICIHATDGRGNKGGMNPSPLPNRNNFATLGVAVRCLWKGKVWKSGTSFAVPIAAGFAADIMEFARCRCTNLKSRKLKKLQRKDGMRAIFERMEKLRDGYDFIAPRSCGTGGGVHKRSRILWILLSAQWSPSSRVQSRTLLKDLSTYILNGSRLLLPCSLSHSSVRSLARSDGRLDSKTNSRACPQF
ncbi:hypothetical protein CHGG_03030 [Chaetomium globosum CBS 148.51]|uniref:Peptidase S8/S53 domain-containing protein n=1 Tax=Chaetomium globosum (strain ATCC 6205 / CBS 148.51 / DSM 1962 / NBRC 6347 / NRRL 1970) TaxID=306901 RepID=Q2H9S4_CHAGB|nr:uncharacterized protein CHGG_03030 [Chaetomium globosum CBS 148.51]EAQ91095.1 hypothetical protein CHGG_03030 [Chaetomium globosum CBS 148.51]